MAADPQSTYRLQLHNGFDFAAAAAAADYLADLGVTHVYTSPVLQAAPGSTHGYDVVDHAHVNCELGGEDGRRNFCRRLNLLGLGWIVDIVPNHMSVALPQLNRWWWDVLRHGPDAQHAAYFDIDWSRGKLLLPVLGDDPDELSRVEIADGELCYYERRFPIAPGTAGGSPREVLRRQHYELASWRRANGELNYRRFFDITDLAGIRVELDQVFTDTHNELLRWVADGDVQGLRVDHPDGLADPPGYLRRLVDADSRIWVVVEKILEPGEELPATWQCAGTTGYDALRHLTGVFVHPSGEAPLTGLYAELTGEPTDFAELAHALKLATTRQNLQAETRRLAQLLPDVPDALDAVGEVISCFPVYRSYLPDSGGEYLAGAVAEASSRRPDLIDAISAVAAAARSAGEFRTRLQQTTGMVMAKGVEDTAFYRYNRLAALSEVGGDPAEFYVSVDDFHTACIARQRDWPKSMTALSTHDTKRSEDVRARLVVLSELPGEWGDAVRRWSTRRPAPDANIGYLAWQTFVAAWPLPRDRAARYLEKASREAKQHTSWTDPNDEYDAALHDFVDAVYADEELLSEITDFTERIAPYGWSNSLAQKLVQLTMPGVPDVYQGTEVWDLSLVDPDNRRPVDYDLRRTLLARLTAGRVPEVDESGLAKLHVVAQALRLRRDRPDVFAAEYHRISAEGPAGEHALAFLRGDAVLTLATRLPATLKGGGGWRGTTVELPDGRWTDRLTGARHSGRVELARLLHGLPVALLVRET